jgi:hypothetical protein
MMPQEDLDDALGGPVVPQPRDAGPGGAQDACAFYARLCTKNEWITLAMISIFYLRQSDY